MFLRLRLSFKLRVAAFTSDEPWVNFVPSHGTMLLLCSEVLKQMKHDLIWKWFDLFKLICPLAVRTNKVGKGRGGFLAGASNDLSITVKRKPVVGSGIPAASLLRVLWLTLRGPPQKCQPLFLSLSLSHSLPPSLSTSLPHTHTHTHTHAQLLGLTLHQYCIFSCCCFENHI